jgi:uncharacterized protein
VTILDELLGSVQDDCPVRSVLVGAHVTIVCGRRCGLASTLASAGPHGRETVRDVGRLREKSSRELAEYARSTSPLEASIGIAALNSLLHIDQSAAVDMNGLELLQRHGTGKRIALVGHFPFVPALKKSAGTLWVFEQQPIEGDLPPEAAPELIPQADVVAVTGSAFVNHTIDGLLSLSGPEAFVVVLGPSTPASAVLFDHHIDALAMAEVVDEAGAMAAIGEGASFREVPGVRLLTVSRPGVKL